MNSAVLLLLLVVPAPSDPALTAKKLYAEKRYEELLRLAQDAPGQSAELDYYRGMALARLERWQEAKRAFQSGAGKAPHDARFPLELAGVAFRQKNLSDARRSLKHALRLDPDNGYANDFLGTVFFLEGNLEAALRYWNREGKPRIEAVRMEPEPDIDPVLLDRAFAVAPASVLWLDDLLATQARIDHLEIFSRRQFELSAAGDDKFDLLFRSRARLGLGHGKLRSLLSLLRGVPYQTVYPEFYNLRRSATNLRSSLRWDAQKRRAFLSLAGPLRKDPHWRFRLYFDGRNENWDVARSSSSVGSRQFNLRKAEAGAELQSIVNDRWSWSSGLGFSHRSFTPVPGGDVFSDGFLLKYRARVDHRLLQIPDRRLVVESSASGQFGRMFVHSFGAFSTLQGSVGAHWLPRPSGDDYEMTARFRSAKTFGDIPFDELFILGLERDNRLWLRGHVGTDHGKKGSAPLGRDFVLLNWEIDKIVYSNGFLKVKLGPFLDSGRAFDSHRSFGSKKWLWDGGAQCKLQILGGVDFVFFYGKDFRSGGNAFYTTVLR